MKHLISPNNQKQNIIVLKNETFDYSKYLDIIYTLFVQIVAFLYPQIELIPLLIIIILYHGKYTSIFIFNTVFIRYNTFNIIAIFIM